LILGHATLRRDTKTGKFGSHSHLIKKWAQLGAFIIIHLPLLNFSITDYFKATRAIETALSSVGERILLSLQKMFEVQPSQQLAKGS
jgi:hypothetical protein